MGRFTKLLKESNNKINLATHPLFNADESKKKDYFQALVFVCVEDENFSDDEKEYLKISLIAMGLNESLFDEFEKFTQEPDEDELLALVDRLKEFNKDEKFSFLVDVCVVAFKDGDFDKSEMELFDEYLEILEMRESRQIILYLANIINTKDIDGAISFYTAQKEVFEKFSYMFELLGIDVEKEMKKIFVYEWVISNMHQGNIRDNNRAALNPISTREFCIFLNSLLMDNTLVQTPDTTRFITVDKEIMIQGIENTNLEYSEENKLFFYADKIKDEPITGFNHIGAKNYVAWVKMNSNKYVDMIALDAYRRHMGGLPSEGNYIEMIMSKENNFDKPEEIFEIFMAQGDEYGLYTSEIFEGSEMKLALMEATELPILNNATFRLMEITETVE